ncbi:MAG: hypothetical protein RBU21_15055 [FCB group bacterium]|jgi:hypothetical protein|nr:hypothetical protein [FCB group bacterium]
MKEQRDKLLLESFLAVSEAARESMEERWAAYDEACKPVTEKLQRLGLAVTGIDESFNPYLPLSPEVVEVLLESLPEMQNWHVVEWMARYIGTATQPYDGRPLADAFDKCPNHHPKWAIGDAFSRSKPLYIEEWLVRTLKNSEHGAARQMLCFTATRLLPPEVANDALMACFDDVPGHAGGALRKTGGQRELEFLRERCERQQELEITRSKVGRWTRWQAKTVQKAIAGIEKRLEKQAAKAKSGRANNVKR